MASFEYSTRNFNFGNNSQNSHIDHRSSTSGQELQAIVTYSSVPLQSDDPGISDSDQHHDKDPIQCFYCSFKGTAEEIQGHLQQCPNEIIKCPNGCGIEDKRMQINIHKHSCPNELIHCRFPGCTERFMKKDDMVHTNNRLSHHLDLLLSMTDEKYEELKKEKEEYAKRICNLEKELAEEKRNSKLKQKEIDDLKRRISVLETELQGYNKQRTCQGRGLKLNFGMKHFNHYKSRNESWETCVMSLDEGYKFFFKIFANGCGELRGKAVCIELFSAKGELDDHLIWPVTTYFNLTLINQRGGEDKKVSECFIWQKPEELCGNCFPSDQLSSSHPTSFIEHSKLPFFLYEDKLLFEVFVTTEHI